MKKIQSLLKPTIAKIILLLIFCFIGFASNILAIFAIMGLDKQATEFYITVSKITLSNYFFESTSLLNSILIFILLIIVYYLIACCFTTIFNFIFKNRIF
jgi:hypothetical protein